MGVGQIMPDMIQELKFCKIKTHTLEIVFVRHSAPNHMLAPILHIQPKSGIGGWCTKNWRYCTI